MGLERAEFDVKRDDYEVIKSHIKSGAKEAIESYDSKKFVFLDGKFSAFKEANINCIYDAQSLL